MVRHCIEAELAPSELEIIDESHMHAGHSGHGGAGHFKVKIVSEKFNGQLPLARHRMVYAAVDSLMPAEIHALCFALPNSIGCAFSGKVQVP